MNTSKRKSTKSPLGPNQMKSNKKSEFAAKEDTAVLSKYSDSMVLAVIFIAIIYWVLDSILNIFFSNKFNLIAELIGPDLYDIYLRVIVLCLFILFGSHAQSIDPDVVRLERLRPRVSQPVDAPLRSIIEVHRITTSRRTRPIGLPRTVRRIAVIPFEGRTAGMHVIRVHVDDLAAATRDQVGDHRPSAEKDAFQII